MTSPAPGTGEWRRLRGDSRGPYEGPRGGAGYEDGWRRPGEGPYSGRGPKGYVRSDDRIRESVCEALSDDSWIDASDVEVSVSGGEVTLDGCVDAPETKHRVESVAERAPGVRRVQNNLRVRDPETRPYSATTRSVPGGR